MKKILRYNKNCKAQIGETLTWVIATLIIALILVAFIIASATLGKAKNLTSSRKVEIGDSKIDLIKTKTEIAYTINNENKSKIEGWIALENFFEKENSVDFEGYGGGDAGGGGAGNEW